MYYYYYYFGIVILDNKDDFHHMSFEKDLAMFTTKEFMPLSFVEVSF
jgi:hypothetical protein